jgi:hypothetical protein
VSRAPAILVVLAAACGAPAPEPTTPAAAEPSAPARSRSGARALTAAVSDPITALAPVPGGDVGWLVPGRLQLELGGTPIDAPGGDRPIEVVMLERHGGRVRAGVRLAHARFAAWTDEAHLLAVVVRDHRVASSPGAATSGTPHAMLRRGARVRRLATRPHHSLVRYVGAVEIEGWVPDEVLAQVAPAMPNVRVPSSRKRMLVIPGSILRTEPRWAARTLATTTISTSLDIVRELDAEWAEVSLIDGEASVHGFVSRRAPPGRTHRPRDPEVPPPAIVANARVASGTCLYARAGGEVVGYLVGDREVRIDDAGGTWSTLSIDSPWGPLAFAARRAPGGFAPCAPEGSVPASQLTGP